MKNTKHPLEKHTQHQVLEAHVKELKRSMIDLFNTYERASTEYTKFLHTCDHENKAGMKRRVIQCEKEYITCYTDLLNQCGNVAKILNNFHDLKMIDRNKLSSV